MNWTDAIVAINEYGQDTWMMDDMCQAQILPRKEIAEVKRGMGAKAMGKVDLIY